MGGGSSFGREGCAVFDSITKQMMYLSLDKKFRLPFWVFVNRVEIKTALMHERIRSMYVSVTNSAHCMWFNVAMCVMFVLHTLHIVCGLMCVYVTMCYVCITNTAHCMCVCMCQCARVCE